jgi:hypothetical protein
MSMTTTRGCMRQRDAQDDTQYTGSNLDRAFSSNDQRRDAGVVAADEGQGAREMRQQSECGGRDISRCDANDMETEDILCPSYTDSLSTRIDKNNL